MHLLLISLSFLLWQNAAAKLSDPMTTTAPIRPTHENLRRQSKIVELQRKLGERAAATSTSADEIIRETLEYCYGEGSICVETNALYDQCDQANPQPRNDTKIEICKCENGYFAADQECGWCQLGFNSSLTFIYNMNQEWSSICSSLSVTFAPVPASAEAVVSAWNATYTGYIPTGGGGGAAVSTPGTGNSVSKSGSISSTTSSRRGSAAGTTTSTFFGGGGGQTTAPPRVTPSGTAQPSSSPKGSSGITSTQGWAKIVYVILLGFVAWFLS